MDYLSHSLNSIAERLRESGALEETPVLNFRAHRPLMNFHRIHAAFFSVDKMPYYRIQNDAATAFYGHNDHDVSAMNLTFYYRHFKVRQLPVLVQVFQFFNRDDRGEFRCTVGLKDFSGTYREMTTATRTVAWDERGKPAYAVVVGAPVCDLSWYQAFEMFGFDFLSEREEEAARLMFCGHSNQEIADKLDLSVKSVEKDLRKVFQHSGTKNRNELFMRVEEHSF